MKFRGSKLSRGGDNFAASLARLIEMEFANLLIQFRMSYLAQHLLISVATGGFPYASSDMRQPTPIDSLSRREKIILQWLVEGLRDKDIGPLLGLTARSVTRVVQEICDKLNARTRTQAACIFLIELKARIDWEIRNTAATQSVGSVDAN